MPPGPRLPRSCTKRTVLLRLALSWNVLRRPAKARRTLALGGAILIGLIPLGYIGREIIRKKSWRDNPGGTVRALGVGLAGGVVLFGLNYGIFLLKIKMGDAFHITLAFLIVAALVAGAIYLMKKKQS